MVVTRRRRLDHERIIELHKSGLTATQIARRMGCSPRSTARIIALAKKAEQEQEKEESIV